MASTITRPSLWTASSCPKRVLPPSSRRTALLDDWRALLIAVARRATPPLGTPQPQGSTYPRESLVWRMVSWIVLRGGAAVAGLGAIGVTRWMEPVVGGADAGLAVEQLTGGSMPTASKRSERASLRTVIRRFPPYDGFGAKQSIGSTIRSRSSIHRSIAPPGGPTASAWA